MNVTVTREAVAWALLFGLAPGLGAAIAVYQFTGQPLTSPDAILVGGGVALTIFLVTILVFTVGSETNDAPETETE